MKRREILGLLLAGACAPLAPPASARNGKLRIVSTHLPPLVLEHGGERPGALHEMVTELCRRLRVAPATEFVPWRRALFLATTMPATTIFPLTRIPSRERQFRWLAPLYDEHYVFVAPRGKRFDVRRPLEMKDRRVTLLRGAAQGAILRELGYRDLVEARSIDEVHRFLKGGMADASFGERNIIRTSLKSRAAEDEFELSAPVRSTTAWLAGSLDHTEDDTLPFQRAMQDMRADGTYRRILGKYGLN
ncbi:substrate-binding periplasmic protein [Pseudoduganella namucuonensis]|uniref:Amino acid ABC transporter substrate-binding protein, PAAT family n=1 Tax=Pseudoduganella namucuonensis TaxID=1035707 RepID=A0A1I7L2T6_9BURK|nr:ABC transporter substrate-binding protein [Pseudoduganella namucuonensis]SFV04092.1 amino acid ABC transporter substrate-binding protein, PAAT family [Pseudoduganella namucuonensis]